MTADTIGGVWTYAVELAAAMRPHGYEYILATMGREPTPAQRAQAALAGNIRLVPSTYRLEWMDDPWPDVDAAGAWLLGLARRERPDLVHLNGFSHGDLPFGAPVLVAGHSCVLSWWRAVRRAAAPREWDEYESRVARGLMGAGMVVAPSRWMLAALERHYGLPARAVAIHNGVDASRFAPADKDPVILAAGRAWDEAKNLALLEQFASSLPWPCLIAGATRATDRGSARSVPHGPRSRNSTVSLGPLDPDLLATQMSRAAIFVHPARYEPFGLAPVEAALSGCALVLGDIPSLREVWADSAIFVDPDDPAELRRVLQRLIVSTRLRESAAARARRRARRYTRPRLAASYAAAYAELLTRAPARPTPGRHAAEPRRAPALDTIHRGAAEPAEGRSHR